MWTVIKAITGLAGTYRYIIMAVALAGALAVVYGHIRNDGIRDTSLATYERDATAYIVTIERLNARVAATNKEKLAALARSSTRLDAMRVTAAAVREANTRIEEEVKYLRFEILEKMSNDEDYADWAYAAVPLDAWKLLHSAATGTP